MRPTFASSAGLNASVPRSWRLRLVVILVRMWLLFACLRSVLGFGLVGMLTFVLGLLFRAVV